MSKTESQTQTDNKLFVLLTSDWHVRATRLIVSLLLGVIYVWMFAGLVTLVIELYHAVPGKWGHAAEDMVKQVVLLLASLELIRVLLSYLQIGRVKVTFILDVALVVLIGELISIWYRDYEVQEVVVSLSVIAVLTVLRIITSRYSPEIAE